MNKRIAKGIVIALAAAALTGALAACGGSGSSERPFDVLVTYNYNVSHLYVTNCPTEYLGLNLGPNGEGVLTHAPSSNFPAGFKQGALEHSYLEGWYLPKCNEAGEPLDTDGHIFRQDAKGNAIKADEEGYLLAKDGETYLMTESGERLFLSPRGMLFSEKKNTPYKMNDSGQVMSQDEKKAIRGEDGKNLFVTRVKVQIDKNRKWRFKEDLVTEDMTLYANFIDSPRIIVLDETGAEVGFYDGNPGAKARVPRSFPQKAGYTFYAFYKDPDHAEPMEDADWTGYTYPTVDRIGEVEEDKFPVHTVYATFIEGTWTIVRTASELAAPLSTNKNIYLDGDLVFNRDTVKFPAGFTYGGTFNGNHHTISGIVVSMTDDRNNQSSNTGFGLFGILQSTANIYNLTIDNAKITLNTYFHPGSYYAGLLAGIVEKGATFSNVKISGTLTVGRVEDSQLFTSGKIFGNDSSEYDGIIDEGVILDDRTALEGN